MTTVEAFIGVAVLALLLCATAIIHHVSEKRAQKLKNNFAENSMVLSVAVALFVPQCLSEYNSNIFKEGITPKKISLKRE